MENPFLHLVQNAQFTSTGDVAARDPVRGWLGGGWYSWLHSCFIFECFKSKASSGFANARLTGPRPEMRDFGLARCRFLSASQRCTSHWLLGICCWQIPPTAIAAFCNVLHVPFLKPWLTQCPKTVEWRPTSSAAGALNFNTDVEAPNNTSRTCSNNPHPSKTWVPILKKKTQFTIQNKRAQHYSLTFWNSQLLELDQNIFQTRRIRIVFLPKMCNLIRSFQLMLSNWEQISFTCRYSQW